MTARFDTRPAARLPDQAGRWTRADRLFAGALDVSAADRPAWLAREANGDDALVALVERLLADACSDDDLPVGGALRGALWEDLAAELEREDGLPEGARVGPWRILHEIGRGGMAVVYKAERADGQFEQRVAIKLLKRGTDSAEVVRRFERERRILAGFTHPGIARLLDAGIAPDGRPFVVLEQVDGHPIDAYCDDRRLTVRERLGLFLQVAHAVEHAHRTLVVHRDIKPSNILVTADGQAKLLDFGIARLLDDPSPAMTRTGARPMTPAFASPEQLRGQPITIAADVYQLGLLLFILLTGRWPYEPKCETPDALERAILEAEPPWPSAAVVPAPSADRLGLRAPTDVAHARGTSLARLRRTLHGDLDNIVLKALRKEPGRRYPDVARLIADIAHYLQGRPVSARADTIRYRVVRFVGRHTVGVSSGALLVASLAGGLVASMHQARRAEQHFHEVRALSRVLLFDVYDGVASLPDSTRVRAQIVSKSLAYLDSLARDAGSDAALRQELAEGYERVGDVQGHPRLANLGQRRAARASYERALDLQRSLPPSDGDDRRSLRATAGLHVKIADVEESEARLAEARAAIDIALPMARTLYARNDRGPDEASLLVDALIARGVVQARAADTTGALEAHREALEVATAWRRTDPAERARRAQARALGRVGMAWSEAGDLQASVVHLRQALDANEALLRDKPHDVALLRDVRLTAGFLGNVLGVPGFLNLGETAQAIGYYERALALSEALVAADPHDARARLDLVNAGWRLGSLRIQSAPGRAIAQLQHTLNGLDALRREARADLDLERRHAAIRMSLADARRREGRLDLAMAILRGVLDTCRELAGRRPSDVGIRSMQRAAHRRLVEIQLARGEIDAAVNAAHGALRFAKASWSDRQGSLYAWWGLADAYGALGRAYAEVAGDTARTRDQRRRAAREAEAWYAHEHAIWAGWGGRAPSSTFDQRRLEASARALAAVQRVARD